MYYSISLDGETMTTRMLRAENHNFEPTTDPSFLRFTELIFVASLVAAYVVNVVKIADFLTV